MLNLNDAVRICNVRLMVLELILSKFPVIWWLNQVPTICNKGVVRLTKLVKLNHTGMFIRELRVTKSLFGLTGHKEILFA